MLFDAYHSARMFGQKVTVDGVGAYYSQTFGEEIEHVRMSDLHNGHDTGHDAGHDTGQAERLLASIGDETLSTKELMARLGMKHRQTFRDNYLLPALRKGLICMTMPDSPKNSRQKYKAATTGM